MAEICAHLIPVRENLNFQGFLRKRKDTMKFTWSRYWFRLQNTTLYFYTDHKSPETSLRGQYYMNSVQSVRSVSCAEGDFPFEIVMKNGKRKLLSADSADLRDVWIKLLWKSMQLPGPGHHNSSCTWHDIPDLIQRVCCASSDEHVEQPSGAARPKGSDDSRGPETAQNTRLLCAVQPLDTGDDSDDSSDGDIYDVPRPQAGRSAPLWGDIMVMDDTPKLNEGHMRVSAPPGPTQMTSTISTEESSP